MLTKDQRWASERPWRDKHIMRELYHGEEMSINDISECFDIAYGTGQKWLEKHEIERRPAPQENEGPHRDESTLRRLYHEQRMTMAEIADELSVGKGTIQYWMNKHDIDRDRVKKVMQRESSKPAPLRNHPDGYERWRDGWYEDTLYVHQLLAIAHGGDPYSLFGGECEVHHENNIPWDNRPENLQVTTRSEHMRKHYESDYDYILEGREKDDA